MSIKLSLYELFAYTLPGGFYLITFIYLLSTLNLVSIDLPTINNFSSWLIIIVIVVSYVLGLLLDPIAFRVQRWLFNKANREHIFDDFKKRYPDLTFHFNAKHAPILRAYVKRLDADLGDTIDRAGATRTMFRNLALNFLLLTLVLLFRYLQSPASFIFIVGIVCSLAAAMLAFSEHSKWERWFFQMTYEGVAAISLEKTKLVHMKNSQHDTGEDKDLLETFLSEHKQVSKR